MASVREDVKLDVVFKEFMSSNNHMLLVRRAPDMPGASDGDVVGLITLEDVMEELIQVCAAAFLLNLDAGKYRCSQVCAQYWCT